MSNIWEPVARSYDPLKAGSIDGTDTVPHDHGIVRAMQAEYKPNKLVIGDPKSTIFVGRLNPLTDESALRKVFSRCGDIKRLRVIRDIVTGFSKGYAFVEYQDKYDATRAQRDLHHSLLDEKEILVDFECERTLRGWIPRRLGGGLSGKKESGQLRFGGKERPFKRPLVPFSSHDRKRRDFRDNNREQDKDYIGTYYQKRDYKNTYHPPGRDHRDYHTERDYKDRDYHTERDCKDRDYHTERDCKDRDYHTERDYKDRDYHTERDYKDRHHRSERDNRSRDYHSERGYKDRYHHKDHKDRDYSAERDREKDVYKKQDTED